MAEEGAATRLRHPNREKASSKATKVVVTFLLLASAILISITLIGGWTVMQGARWLVVVYIGIYVVMAYYVFRWKRGVLIMAASAALLFAVMAAPGLPGWFERTKEGYAVDLLPAAILGLLTMLIVIVQVLLMVAAGVGFGQGWDLEVEERGQDAEDDYYDDGPDGPDGRGGGPADEDDDHGRDDDPVGAGSGRRGNAGPEDQTFA
ncbi:MAG: hypothetical protein ACR2NV_02405 [Thermoleophilaceae bacterium]